MKMKSTKRIKAPDPVTLPELRKSRARSQQDLSKLLNVTQAEVSKMERRPDMNISTLRDFIEALGGCLHILASFPDSEAVSINQFESRADQKCSKPGSDLRSVSPLRKDMQSPRGLDSFWLWNLEAGSGDTGKEKQKQVQADHPEDWFQKLLYQNQQIDFVD